MNGMLNRFPFHATYQPDEYAPHRCAAPGCKWEVATRRQTLCEDHGGEWGISSYTQADGETTWRFSSGDAETSRTG